VIPALEGRLGFASSARVHAALPDVAKGVRAAAVMLGPFYLARVLGRPELAWTALGGWLCTLADPGGARPTRAKALLLFASAGAVLVWASEALAGSAWMAALLLALVTFGLSMLRAIGGTAASLGTLLTMTTAIALARARTTPLRDAVGFGAGALAAAALSSVVWPVWTHLPVRRAVAAVFGELAAYAADVGDAVAAGTPSGDARWSAMIREHHRNIRAALESARAMALAVRARRIGETRFGSNVRALLGEADAQFPLLATAVQEIEGVPPDARPWAGAVLASVVANDREVERVLLTRLIRTRPVDAPVGKGAGDVGIPAHPVFARLGAASRAAFELAHSVDAPRPEVRSIAPAARESSKADLLEAWGQSARALRDALSPRSTIARHALRAACAAVAASLLGSAVSPHEYWVTLTALSILQPYTGATLKRAGERVIGTILGSAAAVMVMVTVRSPLLLSALLVPLSIAAVATRPRSYRLFTFFLTPVFVLLAERHLADWMTAAERAGDAVLGGAVALLAGVIVLPESERDLLPDRLAQMLDVLGAYAARTLGAGGEGADASAAARRAMGVAFGDAETSLERYLAEPRRDEAWSADAMLLVTYARRLSTAMTSLGVLGVTDATSRAGERGQVATYVHHAIMSAQAWVRGEARPTPVEVPAASDPNTPAGAALSRVLGWAALIDSLGAKVPQSASGASE